MPTGSTVFPKRTGSELSKPPTARPAWNGFARFANASGSPACPASRSRFASAGRSADRSWPISFSREQWETRIDLQIALRHGEVLKREEAVPVRLSMLPADVQKFVEENLRPLLSKAEEKRLKEAEGKWPRYLRTLVELADTHPISVLGPIGPTGLNAPKDMPSCRQA